MYDRGLSVLEQYGLESNAVYRTRGALVCETGQGRVLIKEFGGTPRKLECQALLLSDVSGKSQVLTDEILPNLEGGYMSLDKENVPYIVKRWYEGRECDTRCEEDICTGAAALASLHKVMKMPVQEHYVRESLSQEYRRHNAELRKIRKFVSAKKKKNDFELQFLDSIQCFLQHGETALDRLESSGYEKLREHALGEGTVCHGEYNQHNVWILKDHEHAAVTNFDKWSFDVQAADLYQFMRKIMEKYDWDRKLGEKLLETYEEIRPLSKEEREYLSIRFSYPEKYWKLANYYYTHNKAWISEKNVEKLKKITSQHDKWRNFSEKTGM